MKLVHAVSLVVGLLAAANTAAEAAPRAERALIDKCSGKICLRVVQDGDLEFRMTYRGAVQEEATRFFALRIDGMLRGQRRFTMDVDANAKGKATFTPKFHRAGQTYTVKVKYCEKEEGTAGSSIKKPNCTKSSTFRVKVPA